MAKKMTREEKVKLAGKLVRIAEAMMQRAAKAEQPAKPATAKPTKKKP